MRFSTLPALLAGLAFLAPGLAVASPLGYYREPALTGNILVFTAEGDLWKVPADGGTASRLTSAPGEERSPAVSPDGTRLAFVGAYEGPDEVYTMPLAGGLPVRRTYGADRATVVGWTPDGKVIYRTRERSTLPEYQLAVVDAAGDDDAGVGAMIPLAQAADGVYDPAGTTFFFTRYPFQGSHTKRYRGGTAQNIWRFTAGSEAAPLTGDYPGTSKRPMWWEGRIYFVSDRDGTMNLWSMTPDGGDLRQHTHHAGWDVQSPCLEGGRIAYQLGADIHLYTIGPGRDVTVPIALESDLDQTREHWIQKPMDYLTAAHASPDGDRVVLTARGEVFVAPKDRGRLVKAERAEGVRYRDARFMPDGKTLLALSDQSGEVELWTLPADGVGASVQLTDDATTLRWEAVPSPDGKLIAHRDKKHRLFLYDVSRKRNREIDYSPVDQISDLAWSPDSRWLAYVKLAANQFRQIMLYRVSDGSITPVTTDRYDSYSPAWSPDGKWLYLLSDRNLTSAVQTVWGSYQPEPYLHKTTEIYAIPLVPGTRSPFAPPDELQASDNDADAAKGKGARGGASDTDTPKPPAVTVETRGIQGRIQRVPIPAGTFGGLTVTDKALFWLSTPPTESKRNLTAAPIINTDLETKTVLEDVEGYELSADGKKLLVRKDDAFYVVSAEPKTADLDKAKVDLSDWMLSVVPREEWRQMFDEAWRLERDYFYDPGMHGLDWPAMRDKYRPLADRVTSREELADLLGQMVSELSALHIYVYGGEMREGPDAIGNAFLGGVFSRDADAGGYRVDHVYRTDPDEPSEAAPLARPAVGVTEGDLITMVNGTPALSAPDLGALLRNQAGKQVLLRVKPSRGPERDVVAVPMTASETNDLRYDEWEYTRRLRADSLSQGRIGYVHLRAMGGDDYTNWARDYYPVFTREGLIVDVRHNRGGNIDSWILEKLIRKAWSYWSQPVGDAPAWNMQYAFRGHMVVLCDARTASDGELFSEGFRTLGLGPVIGTRTWGGEIWLSSDNFLVDGGIATAAEYGVYGPRGDWLIEGHGVEPDIVVDNLPHATFQGGDAQLDAAVEYLKRRMLEDPVTPPAHPPYPDKSGN